MSTYSDLHKKIIKIIEKYNKNIRNIPMKNRADSLKLAELTKKFFNSINSYGLNELNKIFEGDYFKPFIQKNFTHLDDQESNRYHESYDYLVALTIEKYSQNELLKSLFSKYAEVEQKPERTKCPSFLKHWFQLLGYWFRKLSGKPNYSLKNEARSPLNELNILEAINIIKESLKKNLM